MTSNLEDISTPAKQIKKEDIEIVINEDTTAAAKFEDLHEKTKASLRKMGIESLNPVQSIVLPIAEQGRDVLVQAPTGSGKTLALALPLLTRLHLLEKTQAPRVLVLCPTRELSTQVSSVFEALYKPHGFNVTSVTGGASERLQRMKLNQGSDVVVGTPGRIKDLSERGILDLSQIKTFALDEVDQMLDIGFKDDLEVIMGLKAENSQTLFFSATISGFIKKMCKKLLNNPAIVKLDMKEHKPQIEHVFMKVKRGAEIKALANLLIVEKCANNQAIIFCETKMECEDVTRTLQSVGLRAEALHGDIVQAKRNKVLHDFKTQMNDYLVATNVAARGIDVSGLPLVVNFRLPYDSETYTHRVGRTGRAGQAGRAVTLFDIESKRKYQMICKDLGLTPIEVKVPTQSEIQEVSLNALKEKLLSDSTEKAAKPFAESVEAAWSDFRQSLDTNTFEQVFKHLFLRVSQPHPGFDVAEASFAWSAEKEHSRSGASRSFESRDSFRGRGRPSSGSGFGGGSRPGFGGESSRGSRPSFGDSSRFADRSSSASSDRPSRPARSSSYGDEPRYSDKPKFAEKPTFGDKPKFGEKPTFGDKPKFGERAKLGDRPKFGDKPKFGERPKFGDKPKFGERAYIPGNAAKKSAPIKPRD